MKERINKLLAPFFAHGDERVVTDAATLDVFRVKAIEAGVPADVISQLVEFYEVTNGVDCIDGFHFHSCDDEILFEWWDDKELWLAQRDMDTLRWVNGKFMLGDAGNISYGEAYEFATLTELMEVATNNWYQK